MATDTPDRGSSQARLRKAYLLADELMLSRDERIDLAEYLLRRDVKTWKDLDDAQIRRLLDAMEGSQLINHLHQIAARRAHPSSRGSTASEQISPAG